MSTLTLTQVGAFGFEMKTDKWAVRVDMPVEKGGQDMGPTPSEMMAIALAACKGIAVLKWADQKGIAVKGIGAEVRYEMAEGPRRIGEMEVVLTGVKGQVPGEMHERLEAAVKGCIVARTLENPPVVGTRIE